MQKATKFFAVLGLVAGLLILPTSVSAQTPALTRYENAVDTVIANRCERVTKNIDTRIASYNTNKDKHISRYNQIKDNVQKTVSTLESNNVDVTKLKSLLAELDAKTVEFAQTYAGAIAKLEEAKTYACGNSEGAFKAAVTDARSQIQTAREMSVSIIQFAKTDIKAELQSIRDGLKK